MHKPKQLTGRDFKDITICGLNGEVVPDLTRDNFNQLIAKHNNMVEVVNMLCDKRGIIFDD